MTTKLTVFIALGAAVISPEHFKLAGRVVTLDKEEIPGFLTTWSGCRLYPDMTGRFNFHLDSIEESTDED